MNGALTIKDVIPLSFPVPKNSIPNSIYEKILDETAYNLYIVNLYKFNSGMYPHVYYQDDIIKCTESELPIFKRKLSKKLNTSVEYAKQSFPIKDTEFNIFHDYMVCLGIAKLIFFPNKDEIKSFVKKKSGFFSKFYSLFLKS